MTVIMRRFGLLLTVSLISLPASVRAQDFGDTNNDVGNPAFRDASSAWNQARQQYGASNAQYESQLLTREAQVNSDINSLNASQPALEAKTNFMNNLPSLKTVDALDKWVADARQKWGADHGPHIGISNPYNDESYHRYYTNATYDKNGKITSGGELAVSVVKGDYDMLKRQAADWDQSYQRAKWAADSLNNDYQRVADQYGTVTALKAKLEDLRSVARNENNSSTNNNTTIDNTNNNTTTDNTPTTRDSNDRRSADNETSLVGTTWAMLARYNPNAADPLLQWSDSNGIVTFLDGGVMEYRLRDSGYTDRTKYRYRVEGRDIHISEGGGYWYKYAIKGDRMFNAESGNLGNPYLRRLN
jgi:hypothetical protein